jgi:uncharacterized membrane protein YdjX (TVP38/TMEM64 family)
MDGVQYHFSNGKMAGFTHSPAPLSFLFLRLVFWMPPLLHAFFGVSKVRFSTHFWGSLAGYVIPLFLVSFFGQRLFDALQSLPGRGWLALAIAIAVIALAIWARRRGTARARTCRAQPPQGL